MRVRLVTWNIHKAIGGVDRSYRPDRVVDVLRRYAPDFVLLQEVDEGARRSKGHHQTHLIGDALGLRHRVFHPVVHVRGGGHYGNAILSRHAFTEVRPINLHIPGSKPRCVLHARVRVRSPHGRKARTLHLYNLHLGLTEKLRRLQLELFLISRPFVRLDLRTPIVVAGDLNDVWGRIGRGGLEPFGFRGLARRRTFPAWAPVMALDAIFVRGDAQLGEHPEPRPPGLRWASDHLPLACEIALD